MAQNRIQEIRDEIEAEIARMKEPLFTSKTAADADRHLHACLHIGTSDQDRNVYAEGYKRAADIIVEYIADNDGYQNFLVYPTVFLYRQYLELRLKDLILRSSVLLEQKGDIRKEHNLVSLWAKVRPRIEEVFPQDQTRGHLDTIEERLKEFCQVDPSSEGFRYPQNLKGEPTLSELEQLNMRHLKDVIQGISHVLDGASLGMGEALRAKEMHAGMMAEYQGLMRSQWGEY